MESKGLTELQDLILQLSQPHQYFKKVDQTFIGMPTEDNQSYNQILSKRFAVAVLGNKTSIQFEKIQLKTACLWIKVLQIDQKTIRLIYFPLRSQESKNKDGARSYKEMVMQFLLFNKFLKPEMTPIITLISISIMNAPQVIHSTGLKPSNLQEHFKKVSNDMERKFNLTTYDVKCKIVYIIDVQIERQHLTFTDTIEIQNNILHILTNDKTDNSLYGLEKSDKNIRLKSDPTILFHEKNYQITIPQCHFHFHYNEFRNSRTIIGKDNVMDIKIADQIWSVVLAMLYPVRQIKATIYEQYKLINEGIKQPPKWISDYPVFKGGFQLINKEFSDKSWNQSKDELENQSIQQRQKKNPFITKYKKYQQFNVKFLNQQKNFTHAMILDQINKISKDIKQQNSKIQKQTDDSHMRIILLERKVLEFCKVIVRFLKSLKNYKLFQFSTDYKSDLYQRVFTVYLTAYDEFCWANKLVYGKLFDLSLKMKDIESSKKQIMKVIKTVQNFKQIDKKNTFSPQSLQTRMQALEILIKLLENNKSAQRDRDVEVKILSAKYNLGSTYIQMAVREDFGNNNSYQLKLALKILFGDLLKFLFIDQKDPRYFSQQYADKVQFSEINLLDKISRILKMMGRLDLCIETLKKVGDYDKIDAYYKQWLMKYRDDMGPYDRKQRRKIIGQALSYFKEKDIQTKIQSYYGLLVLNAETKEEKNKVESQRFDYNKQKMDHDLRKKVIQNARTKEYPLLQTTIKSIEILCIIEKPQNEF